MEHSRENITARKKEWTEDRKVVKDIQLDGRVGGRSHGHTVHKMVWKAEWVTEGGHAVEYIDLDGR